MNHSSTIRVLSQGKKHGEVVALQPGQVYAEGTRRDGLRDQLEHALRKAKKRRKAKP